MAREEEEKEVGRKEGRTLKNGGVATQEKGMGVMEVGGPPVTFLITLLLSSLSDEVHRPRLSFSWELCVQVCVQ